MTEAHHPPLAACNAPPIGPDMTEWYLLDTNIICALADTTHSGHAQAQQRLVALGDNPRVLLPVMAIAEIEFGMAKAADIKPEKRRELRDFCGQYKHLPFDDGTIEPYSLLRAELWRLWATPQKRGHKERHPEDLLDKVTGRELGIDEPDLLIASVALEHNLVLVTNDDGIRHIQKASERVVQRGEFPVVLRTTNWSIAPPNPSLRQV
jgi:predicted nucleic acid-binding protein